MIQTTSHTRRWALGGLAFAVIACLGTTAAVAGKKPPPPPPPVDTGTVFFTLNGAAGARALWTMNPDGGAKTALPVQLPAPPFGPDWVVSRDVHGSHRWLLEKRPIPGETYGSQALAARSEWFAVREDGAIVVQLTHQADLQAIGEVAWSPGDAYIAWNARRWVGDAMGPAGIYVAPLSFDGQGNLVGLASEPTTAAIPMPAGILTSYVDWAPDGTRLVLSDGELWTADLGSGAMTRVLRTVRNRQETVLGTGPVWSPDGDRIAYGAGGRIWTIAPDGAGATELTSPASGLVDGGPEWSPQGTHVAFLRRTTQSTSRWDVGRIASVGGAVVNLTADLDTRPVSSGGVGQANPSAWR